MLLAAMVCVLTVNAQKSDSLLTVAFKANTYQLKLNADGKFEGSALPVLRKAIAESQFLLVGEQHGIVEAASFTKALMHEAKPSGYSHFCIETDPYIAAKLAELAKADMSEVVDFMKTNPMSVPFYNSREDFELIQVAVDLFGNQSEVLWGVDQVFMAADRYVFSQLVEIATTEAAGKLAKTYHQKAMEGFEEMMKTGNPTKLLMSSLTKTDFESLKKAFGNDPKSKAVRMIADMEKSQAIYQLWMTGKYYENNNSRVQLMKAQFMDYYNRASVSNSNPKAVFKFGMTHTYRGLSMYDQFDLGNLASELAEMNGSKSVHFAVQGVKGKSQGPFGPAQSFDSSADMNKALLEAISPLLSSDDWIVIDMRPLRAKLPASVLKPIHQLVHGYDFWVYVPAANPVTILGE